MNITLRLTPELHDGLLAMASSPVETGAVLLAHLIPVDENSSLLIGSSIVEVPDDAYEVRTDRSLQITSDGYVHALKQARAGGLVAIWVHSHPGNHAVPRPSRHDAHVNKQLEPLFAERTETDQYGYLVVSHANGMLTFTGAISGPREGPIMRISTAGDRWSFLNGYDRPGATDNALFDRNIRAFGDGIQATISDLTVAIVGTGGTGSAVAEQLTRLGVRSFTLIDPDELSDSNTTRVYGSTPADVGRPKVDVVGDHLKRIAQGVSTRHIRGAITSENVARELLRADVVFGCTDDNAGRLRLSRLPYFYLTPVIDCGIQIHSDSHDIISGIYGRVTTVYPSAACLMCRDRIDVPLADAEMRSAEQQEKLEKDGYAPALPGVEPAVVAFTTLVAASAVGEFLERLVGYGETPPPSEMLLFIHDRAVRANIEKPRPGHYCNPADRQPGPDRDMFLGLNWAS